MPNSSWSHTIRKYIKNNILNCQTEIKRELNSTDFPSPRNNKTFPPFDARREKKNNKKRKETSKSQRWRDAGITPPKLHLPGRIKRPHDTSFYLFSRDDRHGETKSLEQRTYDVYTRTFSLYPEIVRFSVNTSNKAPGKLKYLSRGRWRFKPWPTHTP